MRVTADDGLVHICYSDPDTEGYIVTECGQSTMDGPTLRAATCLECIAEMGRKEAAMREMAAVGAEYIKDRLKEP